MFCLFLLYSNPITRLLPSFIFSMKYRSPNNSRHAFIEFIMIDWIEQLKFSTSLGSVSHNPPKQPVTARRVQYSCAFHCSIGYPEHSRLEENRVVIFCSERCRKCAALNTQSNGRKCRGNYAQYTKRF